MATGSLQQNMTLLWTNSNPGNSFSAQVIPLDLSSYKFIAIQALSGKNASPYNAAKYTSVFAVGEGLQVIAFLASLLRFRNCDPTSTGIDFDHAYNVVTYNTPTQNDDLVIPWKIYGIK